MNYDDYLRVLESEPIPKELAFSVEEYQRRIETVQHYLGDAGLDGILVSNISNVCYLSGYQAFAADLAVYVVVPRNGAPTLVSTALEVPNALLCGWMDDLRSTSWMDPKDAAAKLASVLKEKGLDNAAIGFEPRRSGLTVAVFDGIKAALGNASFQDASDLVARARRIKSPAELEHMRKAAAIADEGIKAGFEAIHPGATENDVAAAGFKAMTLAGSEYFSTQPIVTVGHRTAWAHASFKRKSIEPGDLVFLEFGGAYQRYTCGLMRTASVGPPNDEVRRLADASNAAIETLLGAARAGRRACDVAAEVQASLGAVADEVLTAGMFGYAIGLGFPPTWREMINFVSLDNEEELEAGMTFHSPIPLRIPNRLGVGFSETWAVTDTGCEVLTNNQRELFIAA